METSYKPYAGIGSRETPRPILEAMRSLAFKLGEEGWTLRSGHAPGADQAFESGLTSNHKREIYLPWKGFEGSTSQYYHQCEMAFDIAKCTHPAWDKLSQGAKKLHARNVYQVYGMTLHTPSRFIVCYTEHGWLKGGTATAIRLASNGLNYEDYPIPVFNFGARPRNIGSVVDEVMEFARSIGVD